MTLFGIQRRRFLVAGGAFLAAPALAQTRPQPRPSAVHAASPGGVDQRIAEIIAAAKLGGSVSYAVADLRSGKTLGALRAQTPMPPASVTKAVTALYALDRLGANHRFATRLLATGPITGGVLQGDLILAGGGDPSLDTDRLGDLAAALARSGMRQITGQFLVWSGALPLIARIDADQPDFVGYNPTISGVMLNFNRAQFVWGQAQGQMALAVNAEGARFNPQVRTIDVKSSPRERPLFRYEGAEPRERWTVAAGALNKSGSRWLPVRAPAAYIGDVFTTLCAAQGITLPASSETRQLPQSAQVLVQDRSEPLDSLLRGMLRFSTNLTAEAIGLAASGAATLPASAGAMGDWAKARFGGSARFVDHSGLGYASSTTTADLLRVMLGGAQSAGFMPILRERRIDAQGAEAKQGNLRVLAKSGTLNFTSNLAGFVSAPGKRDLAFAIFATDGARRAAVPMDDREDPPGAAAWNKRARAMQRQMIAAWATA